MKEFCPLRGTMGKKPGTTYRKRTQNRVREHIYVESFMKREVAMTGEAIKKRLHVSTTKLKYAWSEQYLAHTEYDGQDVKQPLEVKSETGLNPNWEEPQYQRCAPHRNNRKIISRYIIKRAMGCRSVTSQQCRETCNFFKVGNWHILFHSIRCCTPPVRNLAYKIAPQKVMKTKHTKSCAPAYLI